MRSILRLPCIGITSRIWSKMPSARASAALASSLDFLQGTFEKIHLQRLLRQQALQIAHLPAELSYRRCNPRAALAGVLKLALPLIQDRAMDAQFLRQRRDAGTIPHPLHRHPPERLRVFSDSFLRHLQSLSLPSVATNSVSFCGVSPRCFPRYFRTADIHVSLLSRVSRDVPGAFARTRSA